MSDNTELLILIDDYLNGNLSGQKLHDFEKKMEMDSDFREEVLMHKDVNELFTHMEIEETKAKAKALIRQKEQKQPTIKAAKETIPKSIAANNRQFTWLKIAAVCLLFLLPILYFVPSLFTQQSTLPQLAETHFQAPENLDGIAFTRNTATITDTKAMWLKANRQYQQKDYNEALLTLNQLNNSDTLALAKGICFYENKQVEKAIVSFEEVIANPQTQFDIKASWYLALAYLANEQSDKALPLLQKIKKEEVGFHKEAAILLTQIP